MYIHLLSWRYSATWFILCNILISVHTHDDLLMPLSERIYCVFIVLLFIYMHVYLYFYCKSKANNWELYGRMMIVKWVLFIQVELCCTPPMTIKLLLYSSSYLSTTSTSKQKRLSIESVFLLTHERSLNISGVPLTTPFCCRTMNIKPQSHSIQSKTLGYSAIFWKAAMLPVCWLVWHLGYSWWTFWSFCHTYSSTWSTHFPTDLQIQQPKGKCMWFMLFHLQFCLLSASYVFLDYTGIPP